VGWLGRVFKREPRRAMSADEIAEDMARRDFKADTDVAGSAADRADGGRVSPCPACSGPRAMDLKPDQVRYWLRLTRNETGDYRLTCSHCGSNEPLPTGMLDWAVQSVEGVNKLLGSEVGAVKTPWGVKSKAEIAEAVQQAKAVENLDRSNVDRAKMESHVAAHHGIGREEQRQQSVGLVIHFHQQSHQQLPQDHAETDLEA
jgi:hypothetical protein